jgi:metallo-beta-lactamase family protein
LRNTILAVGYCPRLTGARILRGDKEVSIFGTNYRVHADVERLESYSGHADFNEMLQFLDCQNRENVKQIVLVHGSIDSQEHFRDRLKEKGFDQVTIPELGDMIAIDG